MKQFIHKSMALFMAAVVLITTMSFTVDMHFCGETLVDYSFFQKVEGCGMEKTQISKITCENPTLTKKACCSDEQMLKQGQDDLRTSFDALSFQQQLFVTSFTYSYLNLFEGTLSNEVPFIDTSPPLIRQNLQVLHQSFLI